jgi:hypothetical protein
MERCDLVSRLFSYMGSQTREGGDPLVSDPVNDHDNVTARKRRPLQKLTLRKEERRRISKEVEVSAMSKRTLVSIATAFFLAVSATAQIHGVPAGATSLGGGHTFANPPGVPASATSLGPRGFTPIRVNPPFITQQNFHHGPQRVHRVIIPVAVPLYSYGAYPYLYSSYSSESTTMSTADYRSEDPAIAAATQPQIVIAPVQQPPQVIVIDNRGVRDATDEEKQEALAAREKAKKPKLEEPKVEVKAEPEDVGPMTVLIFRDGSRREVKNYAIMGKELIVLGTGSMRRIQLAELDLPLTVKENDVRGLDFKLP